MLKQRHVVPETLLGQLVLSFMVAVFLGAALQWLSQTQLMQYRAENQAWSQLRQGQRATEGVYDTQSQQVTNLATLVSVLTDQQGLWQQGTPDELEAYLNTLDEPLELDSILVCSSTDQPVVAIGRVVRYNLCVFQERSGFYVSPEPTQPEAWMLATRRVGDERERFNKVIVGVALDNTFARQLRDQTGLEHTLLANGQLLASSLTTARDIRRTTIRQLPAAIASETGARSGHVFQVDTRTYYALRHPLNTPNLAHEVSLDVQGIMELDRQLRRAELASLLLAILLAILLAAVLARYITRPFGRLVRAAHRLRRGDLDRPVSIGRAPRDVGQVAQTLEAARSGLRASLDDLRQQKRWADDLLQAIVEGIVILDEANRIQFWSQGAAHITGYVRDQTLGRPADEVFALYRSEEQFTEQIPAPGERRKVNVTLADGQPATLSITRAESAPPDGGDTRVVLVFRDVTEEETIHRLLGQFMANITHEFRTPLTALGTSMELLLDEAPRLRQDELEELLRSLHLSVLSLQTLVDNLLESASLEMGHFRVEPRRIELAEMVADAVRTMRPLLRKYEHPLEIRLPESLPPVRADPRRTVQVFVNLLSNANKYSPAGADVVIEASAQGNQIRVTVADRGPGTPEAYQKDLFQRFTFLDADQDGARYGPGLGLWVVKAIVEAQGGQVGVEHRVGDGSIFWFTLPIAE